MKHTKLFNSENECISWLSDDKKMAYPFVGKYQETVIYIKSPDDNPYVSKTPPNNEIWYTTLDNERASLSEVSFKTADEGLIDVTGHYYDGNKWIIKFSDEIGKLYENAISSNSNLDSCILPDSVIWVHQDVFIPLGGFGDVTGNFKIKTSKDEQIRDGRAQISFKLANDTVVSIHCSMI